MRDIDIAPACHATEDALSGRLSLPEGVKLHKLATHADHRGAFTEIFRDSWNVGASPVQWNIVRSEANVLRGVHVHRQHADYLLVVEGEMNLILHDIRADSSLCGFTSVLKLHSTDLHLVVIPVGVAHGFYFPSPGCHIYAVTHGFDGTDEFGCHWQDDHLDLHSLCDAPKLSARDDKAGSYLKMVDDFRLGPDRPRPDRLGPDSPGARPGAAE